MGGLAQETHYLKRSPGLSALKQAPKHQRSDSDVGGFAEDAAKNENNDSEVGGFAQDRRRLETIPDL